ncbi:hypothetical protein R3X25_12235 [Lutibacter sp. TH_r2]|uniref:hypothetical protein n=1 Tax=Lutibacter sp. TH_r2 TaxID=3082083 RepID=UPI0029558D87|nr:hypothetical protein [Lutibacter sp. TH_r2]MDV7188053.1 hypothetical protein [Lutibacter sp. TH_r2]
MKYFLILLIASFSVSCSSTSENSKTIYFGGHIVNPKSNSILLLKNNVVIDTIRLDNKNNFIKKYINLKEGLYTFKHGVEFQYIYFEPSDSILVRLNTWDFDESLVFNGKGSSKNEFLINLFLQNEKEENEIYKYYNLNEKAFELKIDSLANERVQIFNNFKLTQPHLTDEFKKLTTTAIHFPLYRLKEIYPLYHKKAVKSNEFPKLSANFYNYRKDINLNEKKLVAFYPYQNYIISHFYNLNYQLQEQDSTKNNSTENLLNIISENIKIEDFKNTLLKKTIVNDFLKSESSCSINRKALEVFRENCTDKEILSQVEKLVNDSQKVEPKKPLNNFTVTNYKNNEIPINKIIKGKKAIIYFWSTEYMSSEYLVKRIKYLEKQYPSDLFIGVNIQPESIDILNEPNLKLLDTSKQFKLTANSGAYQFLTSKYPRTIVVNKDGIVENGFAYLDSRKFDKALKLK